MATLKRCRLHLPGGEILTIYVRPQYVLFSRTAPGQKHFVHEVYIPRAKLLPTLRWLARSVREVPAKKSAYPPLLTKQHYEVTDRLEADQKRQRREIAEAESHRKRKKLRYQRARERAERARRANDDDD